MGPLLIVKELLGLGTKAYTARQDRKAATEIAKGVQAVKRIENGHTWEMTVAQLSSRFMRWFFAIHIFLALDFTVYLAVKGDENPAVIFQAFNHTPDWFVGLIATMFGFAFGSEPIKNVGAKLAESWVSRKAVKSGN